MTTCSAAAHPRKFRPSWATKWATTSSTTSPRAFCSSPSSMCSPSFTSSTDCSGRSRRWGDRWQVHDVGDPAVLPLVMLLAASFLRAHAGTEHATRVQEKEADMFGLNAAASPTASPRRYPTRRVPQDAPRQAGGIISSSTTPAATTAFTPRCSGKARTSNCSKRRIAAGQPRWRASKSSKPPGHQGHYALHALDVTA